MKLTKEKIMQTGAAGYILRWLIGIPVPILLLISSCAVALKKTQKTALRRRSFAYNRSPTKEERSA